MTESRYQVLKAVGVGGSADVHVASDLARGGALVVLKRMRVASDGELETLAVEFKTLCGLHHPSVARVIDFEEHDGAGQLVEEWVPGPTLAVAAKTATRAQIWRWIGDILCALEYLHDLGLVHGDVKPSNIVISSSTGEGRAVLVDFGLCRPSGFRRSGLSGTPAYLAPEGFHGEPLSPTLDVYAVGIMAYELVTGSHPFRIADSLDDPRALATLLEDHATRTPESPSERLAARGQPRLSPLVDEWILRLLEKQPPDRPRTASQAIASLVTCVGDGGPDFDGLRSLLGQDGDGHYVSAFFATAPLEGRDPAVAAGRSLLASLAARGVPPLVSESAEARCVWFEGGPGSGRSRLVEDLSFEAMGLGLRVASARGGVSSTFAAVRTWLIALECGTSSLDDATDRWAAVDKAAAALLTSASDAPTLPSSMTDTGAPGAPRRDGSPASHQGRGVVLVLDDAHALDEGSRDVLRVLLARLAHDDVQGTRPTTSPPRLGILVASESPPPSVERVATTELPPLTQTDVANWLGRLMPDRTASSGIIDMLVRVGEGRPKSIALLVAALVSQGVLARRRGVLPGDARPRATAGTGAGLIVVKGPGEVVLPTSVADAVAIREATLSSDAQTLLVLLRLAHGPVSASLLADVLGLPLETVESLLRTLVASRMAGPVRAGANATTPGALESAVRYVADPAPVDPRVARDLHARLARALLARRDGGELGLLGAAAHVRQAMLLGDASLAVVGARAAMAAADQARERRDPEREVAALEIAATLARDTSSRLRALEPLCDALRRLGRFDDAARAATSLSELDPASGHLSLAEVALDRGDLSSAITHAIAAKAAGTPATTPLAAAVLARAYVLSGRYDDAAAVVAEALPRAAGLALARLRQSEALVAYYSNRPDDAARLFTSSAEAFADAGDRAGEAAAVNGVGLVAHRRGDLDAALDAYERSRQLAVLGGDRKRVAVAAMNVGTVLQENGRTAAAAERYREALAEAELIGDDAGLARSANNLANGLIVLHRLSEAGYWLERSDRIAERQGSSLLLAYNEALRGKLHHRRGDLELARRALHAALDRLREMGSIGEAVDLSIELGLVARSSADPSGMEHFARVAEQQVTESGTERLRAYCAYLRGEAARLRGELEVARSLLREASADAERQHLFELSWLAEVGLARVYREQGNLLEARTRFGACSERLAAQAAELTGRERELYLSEPERARVLEEARLAMAVDSERGGDSARGGREQVERLLRVLEVNRRLVTERDLQRLLEYILDSAVALTGAERAFIILLEADVEAGVPYDARHYDVRAARNIDQESLRKQRAKISTSVLRDVIEGGEPILTVDAGEDARFRDAASVHALRLRSVLCLPLRAHGKVIGAIYLDNRFQASSFSERDLDIIAAFGDQAAVAVLNARLHEESARQKRELEESHARITALNAALEEKLRGQSERLAEVESDLERQRSELVTRYRYDNIIGHSAPMKRLFGVLDRVTDTGVPILIQGESGTGKELVARATHYNSGRRDRAFVSVNCAALTETLLESELFGHVKGAFTGADRDRKGLFEVADHGTLFLDEVADMSLGMQAKLLRALQEGEIWAVGARRAIKVDVRIVAACNRDLQEMVKEGSFRQDLYFRLNVVRVLLPPLRERGEDMALLVSHFLQRFEKEHGRSFRVAQSAIDLLQRYHWPGNVRELEACLLNACLFCDGSTLTESHFAHKPELGSGGRDGASRGGARGSAQTGGILLDVGDLSLADLEERAILAALERSSGNKVEAARRLGVTRQTLYNKLKALNIEVRRDIRRGD